MSLFQGIDSSAKTAEEKDSVRGQRRTPAASDIYNLIIKYAYGEKSKGGAMGIHLAFAVADGPEKDREIRITDYITSGNDKGNKTYYEKDGEKFNLPGFTAIDSLAQLVLGKSILQCRSEKRTIKLYNFDKKTEVPTDVDMLVELVGKGVCGCVLHQIQDKQAKNAQSGAYEATGKTFETNVVDKYLDPRTRRTVSELKNNLEADFQKKWLEKWKGQIDDQSTEVKSAGLKGAPAASGDNAAKTNLFG